MEAAGSRLACAAVGAALLAAGCGGEEKEERPRLSDLAPADAGAYIEGAVRPTGAQGKELVKVLRSFSSRPVDADSIAPALLEASGVVEGRLGLDDFEPWLGARAAMWLGMNRAGDLDAAVAFDDRNPRAARRFIRNFAGARPKHARAGPHRFLITNRGGAVGELAGRVVLAGSERVFRKTVAALEGRSLADDPEYRRAEQPALPLASLYVRDRNALLRVARGLGGITGGERAALTHVLPERGHTVARLTARAGGVDATFFLPAEKDGPRQPPDLRFAPRHSWLAIASRRLGEWVQDRLAPDGPIPVNSAKLGGRPLLDSLLARLRTGSLSVKGGRSTPFALSGEVKVKDASDVKKLLLRMGRALDGDAAWKVVVKRPKYFPEDVALTINTVRGRAVDALSLNLTKDKLTVQQGEDFDNDALKDSRQFRSASRRLGGAPSFFMDFRGAMTFYALIQGIGPAGYIERGPQISYIAARDKIEGGRRLYKMTLSVNGRRPKAPPTDAAHEPKLS